MREDKYNPSRIEKKWQEYWIKNKTNFTDLKDKSKPKFYNLAMFFYPSGAKIHIGHVYNYTGSDVYGRYKRLKGFNVFEPMGYDAFGLPAENYAIKTGVHPAISTRENISYGRKQLESLGTMYDWEKEVDTSSPEYYKWTQWLFGVLYKAGLAYRAMAPVNWCPSCKTVLANEQVINGYCERCDSQVVQKNLKQWFFKITDYAEKLLEGHKNLNWPEKTIIMQKNWIGRSEGALIKFPISNFQFPIKVFTTRPDTLFGVTFMALSPEHDLVASLLKIKNQKSSEGIPKDSSESLREKIKNIEEVKKYISETKKKTDSERTDLAKEKTGVELKGIKAVNPVNNQEIPIWIADYVLSTYGAGAIMAVPAHDQRDFEFAQKYNLPIKMVICPNYPEPVCPVLDKAYEGEGYLVDSDKFDGIKSEDAREKIINRLSKQGFSEKAVNYKLRDWLISRQRYWGAPIPLIFCTKCKKSKKSEIRNPTAPDTADGGHGGRESENKGEVLNPGWILVPEDQLPVKLPKIENYQPTDQGESPLAKSEEFVNVKCPKCGQLAERSVETMDTFVCSSWYFLRFISPHLQDKPFDKDLSNYWLPVDQYCGGAEHACMHLLYARFINMVLRDQRYIDFDEPFTKLNHQGMILAADGTKMSKSKGNVVIPDEYIKKYGADVFRMYVLFLAPFSEGGVWNDKGIMGIKRFLEKVYKLFQNQNNKSKNKNNMDCVINKTIKKVTEDIENFHFNTAISALMILVNEMDRNKEQLLITDYQMLITLLSPFAPHMTEELWERLGHKTSIFKEKWPEYDPEKIKEDEITVVIQVNGKVRGTVKINSIASEEAIKKIAESSDNVQKWISGKQIKKVIYVAGKLINFVIE